MLELATLGGAQVLGLADKIGSLEVGKRADIAIIDLQQAKTQRVYSVEPAIVYAASGSSVVTTIVDGKILMLDRKLSTVDEKATLAHAKKYRVQILADLEASKKPAQ